MSTVGIQYKLDKLREKSLDPSVDKDDFDSVLDGWAREVERLESLKEYREFEMSKIICQMLISVCKMATRKLIVEEDPIKRAILKADLERSKWLLNIFSEDTDGGLRLIDETIDEAINRLSLNN